MTTLTRTTTDASGGAFVRVGRSMLMLATAIAFAGSCLPASASPLGDAIFTFAHARLGMCVDRAGTTRNASCPSLPAGAVGDGECTDLAQAALRAESAKPMSIRWNWYARRQSYLWGVVVDQPYQKGDIIQFYGVKFTSPDGRSWWGTGEGGHHTAIIAGASGLSLDILEQNNNAVRAVTERTIDLSWPHTGGYVVFRPQSAAPFYTVPMDSNVTRNPHRFF